MYVVYVTYGFNNKKMFFKKCWFAIKRRRIVIRVWIGGFVINETEKRLKKNSVSGEAEEIGSVFISLSLTPVTVL